MDSYFCNISKTLTQDYLAKLNCKILENENLSHFQSKRRIWDVSFFAELHIVNKTVVLFYQRYF